MRYKIILSVLLSLFINLIAYTQDTIRLKNGIVFYGLITEVSKSEIKFRIDGGSIALGQVFSYNKSGVNYVLANSPAGSITGTENKKPLSQPDCERKNVGDMTFVNKTDKAVLVHIYAIATPIKAGSGNENDNPLIAQITISANSSKTAYELTNGVHYIVYNFESDPGEYYGKNGTGQIRITKCETGSFVLQ